MGKAGVNFQYSTNGGSTWTSFYSHIPVNQDINYGPQTFSIGPLSGMTNLNQVQIQVQATAQGLSSDSDVTVSAATGQGGLTSAAVGSYDSGTVTITVNGHADSVSFQAGSTQQTIASALVSAINNDASAPVMPARRSRLHWHRRAPDSRSPAK